MDKRSLSMTHVPEGNAEGGERFESGPKGGKGGWLERGRLPAMSPEDPPYPTPPTARGQSRPRPSHGPAAQRGAQPTPTPSPKLPITRWVAYGMSFV